jgi:signal recognition particle subunit SRP54
MFDNLQDKMDRVFKTLRGEATLNEWHIDNALKEIRVALLEADVHFKTVKEFTIRVREKAVGGDVLTAFSPRNRSRKSSATSSRSSSAATKSASRSSAAPR